MNDSDYFFLRWDNFKTNLIDGFQSLLEAGEFVDVTLVAGDQLFHAHKVVLSAYSTYFRNIFKSNPCQHPVIILKDVEPRELNSIMHFMYRGEAVLRRSELTPFLQTAKTLNIKGLIEHDPSAIESNDDTEPSGLRIGHVSSVSVNDAEANDTEGDFSGWDSSSEAFPEEPVSSALTPAPYLMTADVDREPDSTANHLIPAQYMSLQDMQERENTHADNVNNENDNDGKEDNREEAALQENPRMPLANLLQGSFQDWNLQRVKLEEIPPSDQGSSASFPAGGLSQVGQEPDPRTSRKPQNKRVSRASTMESYNCPLCGTSYLLKSSLRMHMTMSHKGMKDHKSSIPTEGLKKAPVNKTLQKRRALLMQGHRKLKHQANPVRRSFSCPLCDMPFSCRVDLLSHNQKNHAVVKGPLICPRCRKIFKNMHSLRSHIYHTCRKKSEKQPTRQANNQNTRMRQQK